MRIHLTWIRVTATAAFLAGTGAQTSSAQYSPYRPMPQPVAPAVQPATTATPRVASQPRYYHQAMQESESSRQAQTPAQTVVMPYPQTSAEYFPPATALPAYTQATTPAPSPSYAQAPAATQAPMYSPTPAYAQPATPYQPYPRVAYQPAETAPTPPPAEPQDPLPPPAQPEVLPTDAAADDTHGQTHEAPAQNGAMQNGQSVPSYTAGSNCSTNGYPTGSYYTGDQACGAGYGLSDQFEDSGREAQWFGGVYYLFMERDRPSPQKLAVVVPDTATFPNWPDSGWGALVNPDPDFRSGVEVRFGSTFTIGDDCGTYDMGCNTGCGDCGSCSIPTLYAWEFAWWGIDDDMNGAMVADWPTGGSGIYGMVNFAGLGYDSDGDGTIDSDVNDHYGYELPIPAASSEVLAQHVCTNFQAQNFELNIIRFPVCNVSCGGCDPCGGDSCEPALAFSMYGSCGVRYFRTEEEFLYGTEFAGTSGQTQFDGWSYSADNELFYDIKVDNNLLGPQLGWTMNYCYARWNFFANSTFGVFGNRIEHEQSLWTGGVGAVRFAGSNEEFYVESEKDDIAFLGELRLGGSFDFSCHWRGVLAYRAVAISGIANTTDQIPSDFSNPEWVAIIDSDNSMVVHGVQTGLECRY